MGILPEKKFGTPPSQRIGFYYIDLGGKVNGFRRAGGLENVAPS